MPSKNLTNRQLMVKAIEVMKQSVPEGRGDGKASPLVGAVLVKADGSVETAYRGELREGDHAEFTLLERKNRAHKLDGSILFATLEPCAPGARKHPKLCCAERIVNARIKEVWVGIEDPDPLVDRKGIKYLQDNGVVVHMFDRDLQEEIQAANKEFIEQALERRAAAEKPEEDLVLSELENSVPTAEMNDFSSEALEKYRSAAKIGAAAGSDQFQRKLLLQGLLKVEGNKRLPTKSGLLLLGESPRDVMPQAGLLGTIHWPDGTEEIRDFDGPMVLAPGDAIRWLKDKLPNPINRSDAQRKEGNEKFYELVREGIVNALIHRDYDITGAKCQLVVTSDTITIKSPGKPVPPITLEQLRAFTAPMLSRNPVLHYVFAKMELAEERGLGLKSMRSKAAEAKLPLPVYTLEEPYLVLTLYRTPDASVKGLGGAKIAKLPQEEQKGWAFLSSETEVTQSDYARNLDVTARTAQRHLAHFVELGLLKRVGAGPATKYVKP